MVAATAIHLNMLFIASGMARISTIPASGMNVINVSA